MKVMRVPLLAGRMFTAADNSASAGVVIINDVIARRYFANQDPIGQRVAFDRVPDSTSYWRTIVGVVGSERQETLAAEPLGEFFAPVGQELRRGMVLMLRSTTPPEGLESAVRRLVSDLDPDLPIVALRTMTQIQAASLARQRFLSSLLLMFALVGFSLAAIGVYGMVAQVARRRTREMGIRLALGATRENIYWLVVREGLGLTLTGIVIGLVAAGAVTRLMTSMLFGVRPADPLTMVTVAVALLLTGVLAAWIPAWRAGRCDPARTLRTE